MQNVIVGIDGTAASQAALHWAAGTVGRSGRIHAVVAVNPWTERVVDAVSGRYVPFREALERDLVESWTADAGFAVGELHTSVSASSTAAALDDALVADGADAIVIGRHADARDLVRRVGHSTNQLLRRARGAVVVVPPDFETELRGGTVVVGIGHGDATRAAVRWAAHLVVPHRVRVELLHASGDAPVFQASGPGDLVRHEFGRGSSPDPAADRVDHFAALLETLVGAELSLTVSVPPGLAAHRLVEASSSASLLVLGRHRSRWDGGHHTGQPLRYALTHATCPVAVVPDHPTDEPPNERVR